MVTKIMRMIKVVMMMIKVMIMRMIMEIIMVKNMAMIMRMMVTAPWRACWCIVIMKGSVETESACSCCTITLWHNYIVGRLKTLS